MADQIFATSISCMDGRIQSAISDWIKKEFKVDYVDTITEPGVDKAISDDGIAVALAKKAMISVRAHGSKTIVISGHHDCAANPVTSKEHADYIHKGVETVKSWELGAEIVGVWVNESWQVERL